MLDTAPRGRAPSRRTQFESDTIALLERAGRAMGWEPWAGDRHDARLVDELDFACALVRARVQEHGPALKRAALLELSALQCALDDVRHELREAQLEERYQALVGVQAALGRLRGIGSTSEMLDRATAELCRCCGFDRAILFQVIESQMVPVGVHYEGDPEGAAELLRVGRAHPALLDQALLETEMVRRRMAMLVPDAQHDPRVHPQIAQASDSQSYVAAPIMPEGRVIGFLHGDRYYQRRAVDEFDRDMIWTFAEGFGYAYERTVLLERLRIQRDQVREMMTASEELIDEVMGAEIEVGRLVGEDTAATGRAAAMLAGESSRLDQLLTRREVEVIRLMAEGRTNGGIAAQLIISEGTVKSHVKHILRKLRAVNRAEAVSRYLRINALGEL